MENTFKLRIENIAKELYPNELILVGNKVLFFDDLKLYFVIKIGEKCCKFDFEKIIDRSLLYGVNRKETEDNMIKEELYKLVDNIEVIS